jgi:ferredoxin
VQPDGFRVPCLGGLSAYALLELRLEAGDRPIHLIDRGWCGDCPAGGAEHPAGPSLESAAALLAAMGAASLAPALVRRPLPRRRAGTPREMDVPAVPARRTALRRLAGSCDRTAAGERPPLRRAAADLPLDPVAHRRTAAVLHRLSARLNAPVPEAFFPTIAMADGCRNHQVCARVCPTGALAAEAGTTETRMMFDSTRCLACGACVRHCPEHALSLTSDTPSAAAQRAPIALTRHRQRTCRLCEQPFAEPGTDALCPQCRKTRAFAAAGFAFRFGLESAMDAQHASVRPGAQAAAGIAAHPV